MGYQLQAYSIEELRRVSAPGAVLPVLFWLLPVGRSSPLYMTSSPRAPLAGRSASTSRLTACQIERVKAAVERHGVGLMWSPNYSIGVNVFARLVSEAARLLAAENDYEAWAWEIHHSTKKDAPSGTLVSSRPQSLVPAPWRLTPSSTSTAHGSRSSRARARRRSVYRGRPPGGARPLDHRHAQSRCRRLLPARVQLDRRCGRRCGLPDCHRCPAPGLHSSRDGPRPGSSTASCTPRLLTTRPAMNAPNE